MLQIYIVDVYCSTNTYAGILLESLGARKADAPSLQYRMFAAFVASASDAFATAIPHLLHPTDTDTMSLSSRRRALAAGQVDSSDLLRQQPGGYLMHPAILDATTHTAATLQGTQKTEAGITRVPVGVHALLARSVPLGRTARHWCQGTILASAGNGVALTNFAMAVSGDSGIYISGFEAKRISRHAFGSFEKPTTSRSSIAQVGSEDAHARETSHMLATRANVSTLQQLVHQIAETVLGAAMPPDQPLMEAGLDSLGEWKSTEQALVEMHRSSLCHDWLFKPPCDR